MITVRRLVISFKVAASVLVAGLMAVLFAVPASADGYWNCPYGWLCFFQDVNGTGRMVSFYVQSDGTFYNPDVNNQDFRWGDFNDQASSLVNRTDHYFCAWEDIYGGGNSYFIRPGDWGNMNPFSYWNDRISSVYTSCVS